ncbi:phosphatidylinositol N-acetylglucosaminyltransferase subunit C [Neodiprion pinetum]|uniref:phosphatidylinositol N-acetylglucosaminyltransferase subunit C n=1 Tax=Neodiprion pinetum TaxID=441929 RepID=UPI001EDDE82A|nr:phosphatidylinositol N-acetylglucosaminyltransferase subunit C [Neodiprion pinetum]
MSYSMNDIPLESHLTQKRRMSHCELEAPVMNGKKTNGVVTRRWRKNLYETRGLPDNYTDSSFLEELRKNINPSNITTIEAISFAASVSVQLNIVILFVIVFVWLDNEWIAPNAIFVFSGILTLAGYFLHTFKKSDMLEKMSKDLRTVLIFLAFGYILSPILKTLTATVSTDTIYAMTIFMFLIHLIFSKYGSPQVSLSDSLSITSSIFGSLMLASRLVSPLHAFSLLTTAVLCFVLLPFVMFQIDGKVCITIVLSATTTYLLYVISLTISCVFIGVTIFLQLVCPLCYIRWQTYKENIYGPWDEAVITS